MRSRIMARSKLREAPHHLHHHPACWGGGIDAFSQAAEACTPTLNLFEQRQQVFKAAAEAVELPHHEDVSIAELFQCTVQLGPVPATTTGLFLVNPLYSNRLKCPQLQSRVLVTLRDPCVTNQHGSGLHKRALQVKEGIFA